MKKNYAKIIEEIYGTKPSWVEEDNTSPEDAWEVHHTIPDSSSYKLTNALRQHDYYDSIDATQEVEKWQEEIKRLKTEYPLIHNKGE